MKDYRKLRERCVMPELFQGWRPGKTLEVIRETFEKEPHWMLNNILKRDFPRKTAVEEQAAGKWSYGYCYYIAEVVTLIFDAIPLSYQRLFKKNKKNAGKYATHWVLKIGNFCFDPEESCPMSARKYSEYAARNFTPQHPSRNAIRLFVRIFQHCVNTGRFDSRQQKVAKQFIADFGKL